MAKKPNWIYRQSAVIPYFWDADSLKIVLITASSSRKWIIPKGIVERDMTPEESAAQEAFEEAGVLGEVSDEMLSEYEYQKWGGVCHVQVFPMEVSEILETWQEMDARERKIIEAEKAVAAVKPILKDILAEFIRQCDTDRV